MKIVRRRREDTEPWARAHVRVKGEEVDKLTLPADLHHIAHVGRSRQVLTFEIPNSDEKPMHDLLVAATAFLRRHERTLAQLPDTEIDLFLGWTPKPDQESAVVDAELIDVLGRLRGTIYFDTYCR